MPNIDRNTPQVVHITWTRKDVYDDRCINPREKDEGMTEERADDYGEGWQYIGVVAHADILVPIGGNSFRMLELDSAGLWGVESDSGEEYLNEIYEEEKAELRSQLATLGLALAIPAQHAGAEVAIEIDA